MTLLERRKQARFTQEELAGILGVSREAVSRWEQGNRVPRLEHIKHMAEVLGCSAQDIIDSFDTVA